MKANTYTAVVESGSCSPDYRRWEEKATCGHKHRTLSAALECLAKQQASYCDHGRRAGLRCAACLGYAQARHTSALWYGGTIHNQHGERVDR